MKLFFIYKNVIFPEVLENPNLEKKEIGPRQGQGILHSGGHPILLVFFSVNSFSSHLRAHKRELYSFRPHFCISPEVLGDGGLVAESCPTLVTPWTVAHPAPLSMGFSRQEYWSGFTFPSPGDLPNPGIEPGPPTLQADTLPSEPPGKPN